MMLWYFKKVLWLILVFWSARNSSKTWEMVFVMGIALVHDSSFHLPNRPQVAIGVRLGGILGPQTSPIRLLCLEGFQLLGEQRHELLRSNSDFLVALYPVYRLEEDELNRCH